MLCVYARCMTSYDSCTPLMKDLGELVLGQVGLGPADSSLAGGILTAVVLVGDALFELGADHRGGRVIGILPDGLAPEAPLEGPDGVEDEAGSDLLQGQAVHRWESTSILTVYSGRDDLVVPEPDPVVKEGELEQVVKVGLGLPVALGYGKDVRKEALHQEAFGRGVKGRVKG